MEPLFQRERGWGEGRWSPDGSGARTTSAPHPPLRGTCIRYIHVPHPPGGFALQLGIPAKLSPAGRRADTATAMQTEDDIELKKLRWRCRRGMRELDQLFGRYLDQRWRQAPTDERVVFLQLLDTEDDKLWRWSMGYEACPDAQQARLLDYIRTLPL